MAKGIKKVKCPVPHFFSPLKGTRGQRGYEGQTSASLSSSQGTQMEVFSIHVE